ncbi:MAG TPA: hypothetical protein GXX18_08935 [Bacillales bacterium]|nr:hypothetical protein [Bacillales bacterium]
MTEMDQKNVEILNIELLKQIDRLRKTIGIYEGLAEAVRTATVINRSIYTEEEEDWLSIDRDDYARVMEVVSTLDIWKPWNHTIQQRIT